MSVDSTQTAADKEHLGVLALFHYILAGFQFLIGCFPFIHLALGIAVVTGVMDDNGNKNGFPGPGGVNQQAEFEEDFPGAEIPGGAPFRPGNPGGQPEEFPIMLGWMFILIGTFGILSMWSLAVLMLLAGRKLAKQKSHTFCFVVACIECIMMPFGTVLGIITILALSRPSVKELFQESQKREDAFQLENL